MKPKYKSGDKINGYTIISYNGDSTYETICDTCNRHRKRMRAYDIKRRPCKHYQYRWQYPKLRVLFRIIYSRCYYPLSKDYEHYGGRGIKIEDCWLKDHGYFEEWCIENGYESGLQIDRIDVNGNYGPSNCRFVTNLENQNNKRNNHFYTAQGITLTSAEWERKFNIHRPGSISEYCRRHGQALTELRLEHGWHDYYLKAGDTI